MSHTTQTQIRLIGWTVLDVVEEDVYVALNEARGTVAIIAHVGDHVVRLSQESSYEQTLARVETLRKRSLVYRIDRLFDSLAA